MEYRIASFNVRKWGASSKKDFAKIAEIIVEENLDVVALQEIFSEGKGVENLLKELVKRELYNWDVRFPDPNETRNFESRGETYAYLWNKRRFKLVEFSKLGVKRIFDPRIISRSDVGVDCSFFARAPFYIRLQPQYGGFFELRLINIHIYYGDRTWSSIQKRREEFRVLTEEIYPSISTRAYGQYRKPYTIAMGDYNLNIFSPSVQTEAKNCYLSNVYSYYDGKEEVHVLTVQDQLTTLKSLDENARNLGVPENGYANNYDHFTFSPELAGFINVSYRTIDAVEKYCKGDFSYYLDNISDHLPIVMTVTI